MRADGPGVAVNWRLTSYLNYRCKHAMVIIGPSLTSEVLGGALSVATKGS